MSILYKKYKKYYYMFIIPALLLYTFALLIPLFLGTIPFSFENWNLMRGTKSFAGFENYIKLFSDADFWKAFLFNLNLGAWTIIGSNVVGFIIAYFLNKSIKAKGLIRALFLYQHYFRCVSCIYLDIYFCTDSSKYCGDDEFGVVRQYQLVWKS